MASSLPLRTYFTKLKLEYAALLRQSRDREKTRV